jgi:hypothetical protein
LVISRIYASRRFLHTHDNLVPPCTSLRVVIIAIVPANAGSSDTHTALLDDALAGWGCPITRATETSPAG